MHRALSSIAVAPAIGSFLRGSSIRNMSALSKVSHVIFDMDGLLLDTEHIYESVVRDILRLFGKEYPFEVRMKVMGTTEQHTGELIVNDLGLPISVKEFLHLHTEMCRERFTKLDLLKGAERLIRHLHEHQVPFCLATSSGQEMAELKMSNHPELFDLFHHKVMGSTDPDVTKGKPAPDIFLVAANRFPDRPHPRQCLVFEDAPNGVKAAVSAGMQSVMIPDKIVKPELRQEATVVLDSLEEFQPEVFGLPKF